MVPKLSMVPLLKMPLLLPLFDTVIVPLLVRVPRIVRPTSLKLSITSVVPDGTTSSSPAAIVLLLVLIVHVLVPAFHTPPNVGHEVPSSVVVVALAS